MAESNETTVSLCQVRDLYPGNVDVNLCEGLIDTWDKASRQLYKLSLAWTKFGQRKENATKLRQTKRAVQPINSKPITDV